MNHSVKHKVLELFGCRSRNKTNLFLKNVSLHVWSLVADGTSDKPFKLTLPCSVNVQPLR